MEPADILNEAEDRAFWMAVSEFSLRAIWDHPADDVYARLLNEPEDDAGE